MRTIRLIAATALLLAGCEVTEVTSNQTADSGPVATASAGTDEQAIRALNDRWLQLIRDRDSAAIGELYAEDGAVMPQGEPIRVGRSAIAAWWAKSMEMPDYSLTFDEESVTVSQSGDMALDRGTWQFSATPESGPVRDSGKYVVVWRKIGNEWKVAADIFNSDGQQAGNPPS